MTEKFREDRPDVIVVMTTQWRASAFGFAGDPNAKTPFLDSLKEDSLWLRQAVTPHPFGVFARAAFLTGTRSPANGVSDYFDPLPADARTLADAFGEEGYETAFFGKWQLFERDPDAPVVGEAHARVVVPNDRRGGFEFWEGFESGFLLNDPLLHGTDILEPTRFEGYQSDVLIERFMRFRENRKSNRPLFALISLDPPHPPYAADASGVKAANPEDVVPLKGTTRDQDLRAMAQRELAGYYSHIEATDRAIGRLVSDLKSSGVWKDSYFAFTSAHGDMHGVDGKFRKGWPDDAAIRVPMLLVGPDIEAGEDDSLLMSLVDLGPSLLSLAGVDNALGRDGQDLSDVVRTGGPGPAQQEISMPSVPPFEKQCPFVWTANRVPERTEVFPENDSPYTLENHEKWEFEA
ncbi:sulfatase-like hydrolase/transferase [Pelagicoccus mobilis]|uniref:Sulfatase-like hydrolase/transferase n=1 Tax=Pelagicoccus mobilis TaxID=415221 RepID=A0A934S2W0_9BACT|nr:sulfatase-like hydrolase/transferase [Pelagicoccus mobilis]MBK1878424.1 sulfatase-like hydrolase/transferase [Pelagicoccus mobilis]